MPKAKKNKPQSIEVQIIPTNEKVSKRIYSNYVQVSHSSQDFTLTFCDVLPIAADQKNEILKSKKMFAPIQVEIVIPYSLVEPLIKAISDNYEKSKKIKKA
jgi:hypothetical protein